MNDKNLKNEEIEIDLQRIFSALLSKAWLISLVSIVCAVLTFMGTWLFVVPKYQSAAMFYVNNSSVNIGDAALSITTGDINASRGLVSSYIVILNTRETLKDVIDYADVDRSVSEVKGMISAESVDETEIFRVVVTSTDPVEAEKIADAISYILPKRISNIIEGTSAKIVDSAIMPSRPSSPSYAKSAAIGFVLGLLMSAGIVVLRELMDITVRNEEDVNDSCNYPILAAVPDMGLSGKGGSYYGYGHKSTSKGKTGAKPELVGGNISFAAAEAYKLLRTKLQFSFTAEKKSRIIGVSSALSGEGKSLSSVNIAYSLGQLGKKVLLIDCDMRRPTLAEKLPIKKYPGLSDFLAGQHNSESVIQYCGIKDEEQAFHAISAGRTPPNPMELLGSQRMEKTLEKLREKYDYIILDLPPVGEVGDALEASKLTDGVLLVVRQDYCNRIALNATVRQFEFVDAKLLGIVFNCTTEGRSGYGGKYYGKYYRRYYRRYYKSYESAYETAAMKNAVKEEND